jgi:hypothetical protein
MGAKLGKRINPVLNFKSILLTESIHLLVDYTEVVFLLHITINNNKTFYPFSPKQVGVG